MNRQLGSVLLLGNMEDKSVKPGIEPDLAGEAAFRRGSFSKLEQIGFHAVIRQTPDLIDPSRIDLDVACGTRALAAAIAVDAGNIVEQRRVACRQALADFDGELVAIVSDKSDLDH